MEALSPCCSVYLVVALTVTALIALHAVSQRRRKTVNLTGRHAVVMGGTSGIGRCVAELLVRMGANVTVGARNFVKLEETAVALNAMRKSPSQEVHTLSVDAAAGAASVEKAMREAAERGGHVYMLVNCAGAAVCGRLEDMTEADVLHLTHLNFLASLWLARAVLPAMKAKGDGHIVFVSSQAALLGIYGYSAYGATKWAVRGLAEALMMETVGTGVKVNISFPPDTDTPGFELEEASKPLETKLISGSGGLYPARTVAEELVYDALAGLPYSTVGFEGKLLLIACGMTSAGLFRTFIQALLMGPVRLIIMGYEYYFHQIIKKCRKDKNTNKKAN